MALRADNTTAHTLFLNISNMYRILTDATKDTSKRVWCYCHHLHSKMEFCENYITEDNFNNT